MDELIFLATTRQPECRVRIDKHLHGYATLQLMTEGAIELAYDAREYQLEGAWFWPAHPGPRIRFHVAPGHPCWFHRHVGFQGPLVQKWMAQGLWPHEPQPAPPSEDNYAARFDHLIELSRRPDVWGRRRAVNLLEQLLLELAEARASSVPPDAARDGWLPPVLEALNALAGSASRPDTAPDYEAIALSQHLSLPVLRRKFKRATGGTMHAYVLQRRALATRALLEETDLPLKAIADQLGYNNVYFFARQFRLLAGVSPGAYRKSRQA